MTDSTTITNETPTEPVTPDSLARRSMLLRSVGKGSAVLAAASLPVHTLATTPTIVIQGKTDNGRPIRCSISGMQSGMGSRMPATATCTGKSPGYWHEPDHWTASQRAIIRATSRPTFNSFFGATTATGDRTLEEYLRTTGKRYKDQVKGLNDTDDWHWITAWMNAMANGSRGIQNFPYTGPQIIQMYRDPGSFVPGTESIDEKRAYALKFLKLIEGTAG